MFCSLINKKLTLKKGIIALLDKWTAQRTAKFALCCAQLRSLPQNITEHTRAQTFALNCANLRQICAMGAIWLWWYWVALNCAQSHSITLVALCCATDRKCLRAGALSIYLGYWAQISVKRAQLDAIRAQFCTQFCLVLFYAFAHYYFIGAAQFIRR